MRAEDIRFMYMQNPHNSLSKFYDCNNNNLVMQTIHENIVEKRQRMIILEEEREKAIIGRYHSKSIAETLEVKNVRSLIVASWFIYMKYQMVNHRMLNINNINQVDDY